MTGQADCPQCGAVVVTHAVRCPQCGHVPGSVDGWRPPVHEVIHADGSLRVSFEAVDRIRIGVHQEDPLRRPVARATREAAQPRGQLVLVGVGGESGDGAHLAAHLDRLQGVRDFVLDRLRPMSNDEFHRVRELDAYDVAPDWALHHILQHEAEHRSHIAWLRDTYPGT